MNLENKYHLVDDIIAALSDFSFSSDPHIIRHKLAEIAIFLRNEKRLRGNLKGEKTESLGELERSVILLLDRYKGEDFEDIYSLFRECILHIPKFQIFEISIADLRDIAHDFDAACRYDPIFKSIASDIRKLTHQNLSDKVINKIDKLEEFLRSAKTNAIIDGSVIMNAEREDKNRVMLMPELRSLHVLKEKLRLAWSKQGKSSQAEEQTKEMITSLREMFSKALQNKIDHLENFNNFNENFDIATSQLEENNWGDISIGYIRYNLKKLIVDVIANEIEDKGQTIFILMTMDSIFEQVSFFHYSNIVNSDLTIITEENYFKALEILYNLALCSRAIGHGTKHLGRFALLLRRLLDQMKERPDRAAHFPTIVDAMNSELENNLAVLQDLYLDCLHGEDRYAQLNKILNNIIREKTTHLMSNIINSLKTFHSHKYSEQYRKVKSALNYDREFNLHSLIFSFGSDVLPVPSDLICPEYMSGKGYSQVRTSRIIIENSLNNIDIPKGMGFSTLTWNSISDEPSRLQIMEKSLKNIIKGIEEREGKQFGNAQNPLLLMARSGAVLSMPGLLDTISHIGINKDIADSWAKELDEPVRAYQAYLSFVLSYVESVLDLKTDTVIRAAGLAQYGSLYQCSIDELCDAIERIKLTISRLSWGSAHIPEDPFEQLYSSIVAVFKSFENDVVKKQALNYGIPSEYQTACLVQVCLPVLSENDCSGVFFTRNPTTGTLGQEYEESIEYAKGYFGTAVADGTVKPQSTKDFINQYSEHYEYLLKFKYYDEREQRFPTDIEFAIRNNRLFIVQSRALRQSPIGIIANSYDFYKEEIYTPYKLIKRTAFSFNKPVIQNYLDSKHSKAAPVIALGKPVTGGAVRGRVIINKDGIERFEGPLVYLTESNVPPDVIMMVKKVIGYISKEGGITSHAALVAIGEHKPCITDVAWEKGESKSEFILGGTLLKEGDWITLDANTGSIYLEDIPIIESAIVDEEFNSITREIVNVIDDLIAE